MNAISVAVRYYTCSANVASERKNVPGLFIIMNKPGTFSYNVGARPAGDCPIP